MPEKFSIDTFYAIDFDRCLGDVDKSFNLLVGILEESDIASAENLKKLRYKVESTGGSFSPYRFLKQFSNTEWLEIKKRYLELAKVVSIVEDDAHYLIDYLKDTKKPFCIMSYGDEEWQMLKIEASGFGDSPILIVDSPEKARIIKSWQQSGGEFDIPKECFSDLKPRVTREVVLIDDKAISFGGLPVGARGYWVNDGSKSTPNQGFELPEGVISVDSLHGIVASEMDLV